MLTFRIISKKNFKTWSSSKKNNEATIAMATTINVPCIVSFAVGQVTLKASCFTSWINFNGFFILLFSFWQERRESNPQPPVLETGALPIELHSYGVYSKIFVTTPAPTVLPPSLIAKFSFSFIAIGVISLTVNFASSPGITISVPEGNSTSPVTSVVLK